MILDLVGFISTHFQHKPSHGDPFQAKFSKSATVPPALHGVLFEIRLFLAGTSSGTSADVRESDRGERDSSLSGGRPPEMPENVAL